MRFLCASALCPHRETREARSKPNNIGAAPNLDDKGTAVVMDEAIPVQVDGATHNIRARVVLLPDEGSHAMQE